MSQYILNTVQGLDLVLKGKKIFLVKDSAYEFLEIKEYFDKYHCTFFGDFTPNPLYTQVKKGIELFNNTKCDIIVAVGGGSAIDVAKCIKLYCKTSMNINFLEQEKHDTGIELIAIPTTAGTGSESTRHAVIYYEGKKQSISHDSIVPNYAVLDSSVLFTLPIYQKKCTMLDALCQAIESWWSVNSTDESKRYSQIAIKYIRDSWKAYIDDNDKTAANEILKAANYAGRAINITATTAAHAMSYKITSLYGLPHGHAVALCMLEVWSYIRLNTRRCIDIRGSEYLKNTIDEIEKLISYEWYSDLLDSLDFKYPVSHDRVVEIEQLVDSVNVIRLKNNPVELDKNILKVMYERILR